MSETSKKYYDAVMSGNTKLAADLKSQMDEKIKTAQVIRRANPITVNTILNDDNTPAIQIYHFLNKKYKDSYWDWEIETLERMLWLDYGSVMTENNRDKTQAIKLLINNQRPFLDWFYFNQVACALSGVTADFDIVKSPSPGMAIAAMRTMLEIRPDEQFSRDVKKYVSIILINDGIYVPPLSVADIIKDEFDALISKESKELRVPVLHKCKDMIQTQNYGDKDDPVEIQAKRLLICEEASNIYSG